MPSSPGSGVPDTPRPRDASATQHASATVVAAVGASLDALGIGYAQLDDEWTIVYVNATAEAITSSAPGALVGRNHWDVFPAMAGTEFERNYHQAVDTGLLLRRGRGRGRAAGHHRGSPAVADDGPLPVGPVPDGDVSG
jgi:PAS domain-containing protein